MDKKIADELLRRTRENYDNFAESFSRTRDYIWPEVKILVEKHCRRGDSVLDIGCGNGRFYPVFKEIGARYAGIDNSRNLIAIDQKKFPEADFVIGDALDLPFENEKFDFALAAAVVHHIPSNSSRQNFFQQIHRILKPKGILAATVWDLRLPTMIKTKQWRRLESFLKSQMKIALGMEKLDFGDFFIPWQNEYRRYVHAFTVFEMRKLAVAAGFSIKESGSAKTGAKEGNIYIIAEKLHN